MNDLANQIATFWDGRYAAETFIYGETPNAYLAAQSDRLSPGLQETKHDGLASTVRGVFQKRGKSE